MSTPLIPPPSARQEAWDTAAQLASQGLALPVIVDKVLYAASPRIDAETAKAVPARGRTFWVTMATALVWLLAVYITFLVFESAGTHAVLALKLAIYCGVLLWALGFGVVAGNHKVRERRVRVGAAKRAAVERLAKDAARHVWASEIPGSWEPLGPAPVWSTADKDLPTGWWRRFGGAPGEAVPLLVDGSESAVRSAVAAHRNAPVVLFLREPGTFPDGAREFADDSGIALYIAGRDRLLPMSAVASSALQAYERPAGTDSPAQVVLRAWSRAGSMRSPLRSRPGTFDA